MTIFAVAYIGALQKPTPHNVPVGVVGTVPAPVERAFAGTQSFHSQPSTAALLSAIHARRVSGGISGKTAYVASAVATSAYLAAVYLAADAAHDGEEALERQSRARALGSGVVAGALAIAGIFIGDAENHEQFHSLVSGRALSAVIVSGLAGIATLVLVYRRRYEPARYFAAFAVAAIIVGWALSRWPTILPG